MSTPDTYICRCERILAEAVDEAIAEGNLTINDVKRRTRAGMGICQGIYCVGEVGHRLYSAGISEAAIEQMTARPPTRLLSLTVAATETRDSDN